MELDYKAIGRRIRQVRESVGISQEELGKKIGLSTAAISLFESGERKISLGLLNKIAGNLGTSLKELIEGYDKPLRYVSVSFRATEGSPPDDPKFKKALTDAIKEAHEQSRQ